MNTKLSYLYEDGRGHRYFAERVFAGTPAPEQVSRLREAMQPDDDPGTYRFVAKQVGLPSVFPWVADLPGTGRVEFRPEVDPPWHVVTLGDGEEVEPGLLVTDDPPTDGRSLEQFVAEVERAGREGWRMDEVPSAGPDGTVAEMESVDELRDERE